MSARKKEVVESKKGNTLPKEKQRLLKMLSGIICVVSKILRVFAIIAAACLLFCIILVPVVIKNIKIESDSITVFDKKIEYKYDDTGVDLYIDKALIARLNDQEKVSFDTIINEISHADMARTFAFAELALIAAVASVFISYFILRYVDMLFANFKKNETPFTDENTDFLSKISYLYMISVIISIVSDIVSSLLFDSSLINVDLTNVFVVLVLYVITYIFEYACILQKDSKNKIFSE